MPQPTRFLTLLICLSLALAACSAVQASQEPAEIPPGKEGMASLDKPFQLRYDEAMLLPDENIWVRFAAIKSDNRCPKDVQCIQAGEAHIILGISMNGKDSVLVELSTLLEQSTVVVEDYRVLLQAIEPYPQASGQAIPPEDYVITIMITRK